MNLTKKEIQLFSFHNRQIRKLYESAFPRIERMPYPMLMRYSLKKEIEMWGYYDNGRFIGFAYMMVLGGYAYVLYCATKQELRSRGYGTAIIKDRMKHYEGNNMVLDIEPDDPDADNAEQRQRRKEFYLKLGFADTFYEMTDDTGDYRIYTSDIENFRIEEFRRFFGLFPECFDGTEIIDKHPAQQKE